MSTDAKAQLRMSPPKELPKASGSVEVVLLDGGGFTSANDTIIHADGHDNTYYLYNWCFYIYHKETGRRILWDLGISNDRSLYTPFVLNSHWPSCKPTGPRHSLVTQLEHLGVRAEAIDTVIFRLLANESEIHSHAHWDHCRPVKQEFPNAKIFFGPGTKSHCSPGHIKNGEVQPLVQWDSRFFGDKSIQTELFEEFSGPWKPWGPFDHTLDFLDDGSFWIIQAPGHMPGNLAACVRLNSGEHILLASDCCHSKSIFVGSRQIANIKAPDGSVICLHDDLDAALDTIGKLRAAVKDYGVHIALAHDAEFIKDRSDTNLMSLLHPSFDSVSLARIRAGEQA